jgi:hypothetical protein
MIPEAKLAEWERKAERANAAVPFPAGYGAAMEEDARRMIRTELVREAIPCLLGEARAKLRKLDDEDRRFAALIYHAELVIAFSVEHHIISPERLEEEQEELLDGLRGIIAEIRAESPAERTSA